MSRMYTIAVHKRRGRKYEVRIMDHVAHKEGTGTDPNPAEAFRNAERQLGDRIGFITSDDPANWDDDEGEQW